MKIQNTFYLIFIYLISTVLFGCTRTPSRTIPFPSVTDNEIDQTSVTSPSTDRPLNLKPTSTLDFSVYNFPVSIETGNKYLFYLHGKIIEDQGIPAISAEYGEYQYGAILEKLSEYGFIVISEQRPINTDVEQYAHKISEQIKALLDAGVPAENITVVGASKGAAIAIYTSHFLENVNVNFIIMAICHPDIVQALEQGHVFLYGKILSIFDSTDMYAGSCKNLLSESKGGGITSFKEVILNIDLGHGILYKPLDEWIMPIVDWANSRIVP